MNAPNKSTRPRDRFSRLTRFAKKVWAVLTWIRNTTLTLLVSGLVVSALLFAMCSSDDDDIPDEAVLVMAPKGTIVEERGMATVVPLGLAGLGPLPDEVVLRDIIETIAAAKGDERIKVLYLDLSKLSAAGISKLNVIDAALVDYKASGKRLIAYADHYSQAAYHIAARADEIYMHPLGGVFLPGLAHYRTYFKATLDRFEIDWHIFKVGTYKSAVEPYMRETMSEADRAATLTWMEQQWADYTRSVGEARADLVAADVDAFARNYDGLVARAGGNPAKAALDAGLVDGLRHGDEVESMLVEIVGRDEDTKSYHQIGAGEYLAQWRRDHPEPSSGAAVAVVIARGSIRNGKQPPGTIGGESTAALIRKARLDDDVKAIVLRVDSGGGSVFASEQIRREFQLAREAGKPVVVSMSSVAASGGYWISMASDEVWAHPMTLTGSIGIFGMVPNYARALRSYTGAQVDGVSTGAMLAQMRPDLPLPERAKALQQTTIERGYRRFLDTVAEARGMTPDQVDAVAQGRIWTGADAHAHGLVDKLGGLDEAIASAAAKAELGDAYRVDVRQRSRTWAEVVLEELLREARTMVSDSVHVQPSPWTTVEGVISEAFAEHAATLALLQDPDGIYAYAMLDVD